jgi:hypothetical protein
MTLAYMRENGVRSLSVTCELCHHEALMNVDAFDDAIADRRLRPAHGLHRLRIVGADARPNWGKRSGRESLTGNLDERKSAALSSTSGSCQKPSFAYPHPRVHERATMSVPTR